MYTPDGYPKKLSRSATVCFLDAVVFDVDVGIRKSKFNSNYHCSISSISEVFNNLCGMLVRERDPLQVK